jgi:hypothetical protein
VEGRPIAGSCRTAPHRHHSRKGSRDSQDGRRPLCASFFLGSKKGRRREIRPAGLRSPAWLDVVQAVWEVSRGLNGQRAKLKKFLANPQVQTIVVDDRGRLMRFGAEYVEAALAAQGRELIVAQDCCCDSSTRIVSFPAPFGKPPWHKMPCLRNWFIHLSSRFSRVVRCQ